MTPTNVTPGLLEPARRHGRGRALAGHQKGDEQAGCGGAGQEGPPPAGRVATDEAGDGGPMLSEAAAAFDVNTYKVSLFLIQPCAFPTPTTVVTGRCVARNRRCQLVAVSPPTLAVWQPGASVHLVRVYICKLSYLMYHNLAHHPSPAPHPSSSPFWPTLQATHRHAKRSPRRAHALSGGGVW